MQPNALSKARQSIIVPAQSGRSVRVSKGDLVRITDPKGQQVADLWAIVTSPQLDWLSTSQTRDIGERMFPAVGEWFYSNLGRPLLKLVEDGSPGPHDMLFPACSRELYERVGLPDHPNCRDNMRQALRNEGITFPFVPDPVDLFQNSPPQPNGRLDVLPSVNPPGGYVVFQAECDLLLVVTACAVDFHPTNGSCCTEIAIEISRGTQSQEPHSDRALPHGREHGWERPSAVRPQVASLLPNPINHQR